VVCKRNRAKLWHHTLYRPQEKVIGTCRACHVEIHKNNPLYRRYLPPDMRPPGLDRHLKVRVAIRVEPHVKAAIMDYAQQRGTTLSEMTEGMYSLILYGRQAKKLRRLLEVEA